MELVRANRFPLVFLLGVDRVLSCVGRGGLCWVIETALQPKKMSESGQKGYKIWL